MLPKIDHVDKANIPTNQIGLQELLDKSHRDQGRLEAVKACPVHLVCSTACGCVTQRWQASAEAERQCWEEELKVSCARCPVGVVKV